MTTIYYSSAKYILASIVYLLLYSVVSHEVGLILSYSMSTHIVPCTSTVHHDKTPNERLNYTCTHSLTFMLCHYISDHPTFSTDTQLPLVTQTLRCVQTHRQIYTATDTIQYSRPDKLQLLNGRLTTN